MVIANSASSSTLHSLDDVRKIGLEQQTHYDKESSYLRTCLIVPDFDCNSDLDESDSCFSAARCQTALYLPETYDAVDLWLGSIPQLMEPADELLSNPPRLFTESSTERLLYVGQGEVACATSRQCDIIVSDRATTCHILAFRSSSEKGPMVSLTHIDAVEYESCIRGMILEHSHFHADRHFKADALDIDVYVMGGFEDEAESSREISNFVMKLLVEVAAELLDEVTLTLKLCAISSMNDNGYASPIGRGLGISIETGLAFLASVDISVAGPATDLRSARLWSGNSGKELSVIHSHSSNKMLVQPFHFTPLHQLHQLLSLPDPLLLKYTSTSPQVEQDDFCDSVRSTLSFMRHVKCDRVFGPGCRQPAVFCRVNNSNQWKLSTQF